MGKANTFSVSKYYHTCTCTGVSIRVGGVRGKRVPLRMSHLMPQCGVCQFPLLGLCIGYVVACNATGPIDWMPIIGTSSRYSASTYV